MDTQSAEYLNPKNIEVQVQKGKSTVQPSKQKLMEVARKAGKANIESLSADALNDIAKNAKMTPAEAREALISVIRAIPDEKLKDIPYFGGQVVVKT